MPTKKITDTQWINNKQRQCRDPDHNPPNHMVYEPGVYEHICPACGQKQTFHIEGFILKTGEMKDSAPEPWALLNQEIL
jgi:hypothetical protein